MLKTATKPHSRRDRRSARRSADRSRATVIGRTSLQSRHSKSNLGRRAAARDEQRTVVKRNSYAPYGETFAPTAIDGTGYTGHVMDQATGLTYMQQRYYDPQIGRFLSVDPVRPGAKNFNRYWYADNNPFRFTDPDGRATCANPPACTTSTIDHELKRPIRAPQNSQYGGGADSGRANPNVPTQRTESVSVTFVNDEPRNPSPDRPVSTKTANMVEGAIIGAPSVTSVNINSTTGGTHGVNSAHGSGRAVDINSVNGVPVGRGNGAAADLQGAAGQQPAIRENFGPSTMEKTMTSGGNAVPFGSQDLRNDHQTHIHLSSQGGD